jgi:hemerythrin-like metal-binding protein
MNAIKWSSDLELNIPPLDALHKTLVDQIRRTASNDDTDFPSQLMVLITTAETCFSIEEQLMEEIDFPGLKMHREQHARVLGGLHHVLSDALRGDFDSSRRATACMYQWLQAHINTLDSALAMALEFSSYRHDPARAAPHKPWRERRADLQ